MAFAQLRGRLAQDKLKRWPDLRPEQVPTDSRTAALAGGDSDSSWAEPRAAVEQAGARVERHPAAKDATDLELALAAALALEPERILVLGGAVGRLDHLLGELLLLAADVYAGVEV